MIFSLRKMVVFSNEICIIIDISLVINCLQERRKIDLAIKIRIDNLIMRINNPETLNPNT